MVARLDRAQLYLPRDDRGYAMDVGLRSLMLRGVVRDRNGRIEVTQGQEDVLRFYAASIKHLFRDRSI